jgi:endonuclease/exonuclease/phosphatase (EEP) superfamily protein YafD
MMTAPSSTIATAVPHGADRVVRYCLSICLLVAAAPVVGAAWPNGPAEFELAAHFLVQSAVLSCLLLLVGVLTGRRYIVLAVTALLTATALILVPHALSGWVTLPMAARQDPSPAPFPRLNVYFHNAWAGAGDAAATVDAAMASDADILLFAETGESRWRSFARLIERYPHHISCFGRRECDLTLFSRLPIRDQVIYHDRLSGARGVAATVDDGSHGRLRVVAIHLARPIPPDSLEVQMRQVEALLRSDLFRPDLPVLLMGDFNAVPWGRVVGTFARSLQLRPAGGIEGTWPSFLPQPLRIRIDQALVSPDVTVLDQAIGAGSGSDHQSLSITIGPTR